MFGRRKKAKLKEEERAKTTIKINESLLRTQDGQVVRCINIAAHFTNKEETKLYSHDMVRQCFITTAYTLTLDAILQDKAKFEEAALVEINRLIASVPFICDDLSIEQVSKVDLK